MADADADLRDAAHEQRREGGVQPRVVLEITVMTLMRATHHTKAYKPRVIERITAAEPVCQRASLAQVLFKVTE